jgi:hypothetical protein
MAGRKQFLLRIDQGLWEDLETWAADELRSVNGQIEYILREAVRKRKGTPAPSGGEVLTAEKGSENERSTFADARE